MLEISLLSTPLRRWEIPSHSDLIIVWIKPSEIYEIDTEELVAVCGCQWAASCFWKQCVCDSGTSSFLWAVEKSLGTCATHTGRGDSGPQYCNPSMNCWKSGRISCSQDGMNQIHPDSCLLNCTEASVHWNTTKTSSAAWTRGSGLLQK